MDESKWRVEKNKFNNTDSRVSHVANRWNSNLTSDFISPPFFLSRSGILLQFCHRNDGGTSNKKLTLTLYRDISYPSTFAALRHDPLPILFHVKRDCERWQFGSGNFSNLRILIYFGWRAADGVTGIGWYRIRKRVSEEIRSPYPSRRRHGYHHIFRPYSPLRSSYFYIEFATVVTSITCWIMLFSAPVVLSGQRTRRTTPTGGFYGESFATYLFFSEATCRGNNDVASSVLRGFYVAENK